MSDEDFPVRRMKRAKTRKQLNANQAVNGKKHPENIFPLRTYRDRGADAKTVQTVIKMNAQARCEEKLRTDKSFSLFPLQKKIVTWIQTTESGKKTFAEISQRMFSEIMSAFNYRSGVNEDKK